MHPIWPLPSSTGPVINAGDGWHAHPSQALLDLYTVRSHLGELEGLKLVIVGDIMHSRVARSNIWGFARMGARVVLCGPPQLVPRELVRLPGTDGVVQIEPDLDIAVENADVVMALRIQKERMEGVHLPDLREYATLYALTEDRLARARPGALVMHPGPMNQGIEISGRNRLRSQFRRRGTGHQRRRHPHGQHLSALGAWRGGRPQWRVGMS